MLENAGGVGICGVEFVKSWDFRVLARCEGETPSRQPAGRRRYFLIMHIYFTITTVTGVTFLLI